MRNQKTVLLSVYDKTGIVDLAKELVAKDYRIVSSGGTASALKLANIPCMEASELTGFPEMLDGRVKTLHPVIHGGILADRSDANHEAELFENEIDYISMVVCNLYPFEEAIKDIPKTGQALIDKKEIENIDIGGPTMLRAAAKNYKDVVVVTDPKDYPELMKRMKENDVTLMFRKQLAAKVFAYTAYYDAVIANRFCDEKFPEFMTIPMKKVPVTMRYGENGHQQAAMYQTPTDKTPSASMDAEQLHGQDMSFNNQADVDAAWRFVGEYSIDRPTCSIIKHQNTCGAAVGETALDAYKRSFVCDQQSAFGGIIAINCEVSLEMAAEIIETGHFVECIIAHDYDGEALELLKSKKKKLRILKQPNRYVVPAGLAYRQIDGGMLAQDRDTVLYEKFELMTNGRQPTEEEIKALEFALRAVKNVKSNGVVVAYGEQLVGVGTGQQKRIRSLDIAIDNMNAMPADYRGSKAPLVMASDAFFPFGDCVEKFAAHGGKAVIWPAGSNNDQESIDAANKHGIIMIATGTRHFSH
ncbi:MAG: bifunctional phosphoribosylaminoimidazolecarboxamide formyltransferase/IMP cyclohydrolase [Alphaproteobacteria bacterium]|nr:bifunctional phosphoribosylaminoimidazolecarboxamide formyltransferase/IMP cyclohydrolase [Alphaproteobacteria bacterium]